MELVKEALKITLQKQLQALFEDKAVIYVTNDINTLFDGENRMQNDELYFILSCGNGSATTTDKVFMTTPFVLTCICPIGFKNKNRVESKLYEWFTTYALKKPPLPIGTIVGTTPSYYAAFDILSPMTSGSERLFAGQHVIDIVISGNVVTCEQQFQSISAPSILINEIELKNVFVFSLKKTSITNDYVSFGNAFQKHIEMYKQFTYMIQLIYDEQNDLHKSLKNNTELKSYITINDQTFEAYLTIEYTENVASAFTVITLSIVR